MRTALRRYKYIKRVSQTSGEGFFTTAGKMKKANELLGVTFREYERLEFWRKSFTQQLRDSKKTDGNHNRKERAVKHIMEKTGLSREEIADRIRELNRMEVFKLNSFLYDRFEMYNMSDEEARDFTMLLARREELMSSIREDLRKIDEGSLSYEDIAGKLSEYDEMMQTIVSDTVVELMAEKIEPSRPDIVSDPVRMREIAIDMESVRSLLGFNETEYIMFGFADRTLAEKRKFINENERAKVLDSINDMSLADNLDNKFMTYGLVGEYYGRDMISLSSTKDFPVFEKFCQSNPEFVRKLDYDSMGRGVQPYKAEGNIRELFNRIMAESPYGCICEGMIKAHPVIRALNPDSVNTVRLITYFDGSETHVQNCFMKIGQKGSFVDNGGAGGIFAAVNDEKGFFESNGIDEMGRRYDVHPYTNIKFEGYQLPEWDKALELGRKISSRIPGFSYVGWDLTYTEDCEWVIVEGNSITQFLGQQSTRGRGAKAALLDLVGYDEIL